jgi:hypothetical protein
MSDPTPPITSHDFQPYGWDEKRCGYVDGDDWMCGYSEAEHDPNYVPDEDDPAR